ncbi:MAG: hypothetical protein WBE78_02495 [Candidatus Binataceae bacterium]
MSDEKQTEVAMPQRAKGGQPRFPQVVVKRRRVSGLAGFDGFYLWYGIDTRLSPRVKANVSLPN